MPPPNQSTPWHEPLWIEKLLDRANNHRGAAILVSFFVAAFLGGVVAVLWVKLMKTLPPTAQIVEGFRTVKGELLSSSLPGVKYDAGVTDSVYLPDLVKPIRQGTNLLYFRVGVRLEAQTQTNLERRLKQIQGVIDNKDKTQDGVQVTDYGFALEKVSSENEADRPADRILFPWTDGKGETGIGPEAKRVLIEELRFQEGSKNKKAGRCRDPSFQLFKLVPREGFEPSRD